MRDFKICIYLESMNNKKNISITIGVMCMLLTSSILVQLTTIKEATKIVGTTYAQEGLKEEVLRWKENYEALYKELEKSERELEKTRQEITVDNGRGTELEEELSTANKLLGLTKLTGNGVIVILSDNNGVTSSELGTFDDINKYLIHDEDVWSIINELYNAGAEAVSVNGQRITSTTAVTCSGAVITINGIKLSSPFKINAIGNPESLSSVARAGGYIDYLQSRGALVTVEKSNNVTVEKFTGTITAKYAKTIE